MYQNIGRTDRIIRIAAGAVIAALGLAFHSWFGLVSLLFFATAGVGVCPIYLPFGISTRARSAAARQPAAK